MQQMFPCITLKDIAGSKSRRASLARRPASETGRELVQSEGPCHPLTRILLGLASSMAFRISFHYTDNNFISQGLCLDAGSRKPKITLSTPRKCLSSSHSKKFRCHWFSGKRTHRQRPAVLLTFPSVLEDSSYSPTFISDFQAARGRTQITWLCVYQRSISHF